MLIYIAAPWKDKDKMPAISEKFEAAGHTITHKWWEVKEVLESSYTSEALKEQAMADVNGVREADMMVVINSAISEGKSFEQGVATELEMVIISVGKLGEHSKNVFHYLDNYLWVETVEDAIMELEPYAS